MGAAVPLGQVASVQPTQGPPMIRTENAQLVNYIYVDMHDRDIGGYVADAQRALAEKVPIPPGYRLEWSGQFEYLERAKAKLAIVVPVTLVIIFVLLYLNFGRLTETLIVMLSVPFALVGGVWLMAWMQFNLSVAVAVGFIALAGVAAETGVVMLIYLDHALNERRARCAREDRPFTRDDLRAAIMARRRRARAAEDDDGDRDHRRPAADPVDPRHRLGADAAHRRADDRRHGVLDRADADRDPGRLWPGEGLAPAGPQHHAGRYAGASAGRVKPRFPGTGTIMTRPKSLTVAHARRIAPREANARGSSETIPVR